MDNNFDVKKETERVVKWIRDWFSENGLDSPAVIGISGGKDSSVVAKLCCMALGKERVIGVQIPNGVQSDIKYSDLVFESFGIEKYNINISESVIAIKNQLLYNRVKISPQTLTNLPCRVRMTTLYALSQSMNGRVSCNCNKSETYVGWETKWGDAAGDFAPLKTYTCSEVIEIGKYIGVPDKLINKAPSDGLQDKTDEDAFGFTYKQLDEYLTTGKGDDEVIEKIERMHKNALLKSQMSDMKKL